MAYRNYGAAYGGIIAAPRVVNAGSNGDYPDLVAAMTASGAGENFNQVYYLNEGTYANQDFTMPPGVTITSFPGSEVGAATTTGTITINQEGTYVISGIRLVAVGDYAIEITGSDIVDVTLENCEILCQTFTGINFSNSSGSSRLTIKGCTFDNGANVAPIVQSSPGNTFCENCYIFNSTNATAQITISAGLFTAYYCYIISQFATSGTAFLTLQYCYVDSSAFNQTTIIHNSTNGALSPIGHSVFNAGTAPCINVGAGANLSITYSNLNSTNSNVLTGSGQIRYNAINFNSSFGINPSTITGETLRVYRLILGAAGYLEMESGTTLFVDSGATVEVESGAILQVDAGAVTRLPLSGVLIGNGAGNAVTASAMTTNGQLLIGGASGPVAATLTAGTGVSIANGANSITISGSGVTVGAYVATAISYQVLVTDNIIGVTSNAAGRTITMPNSGMTAGQKWVVKDEAGTAQSANNITINGNGANIDGAATYVINTNYGSAELYWSGSNFFVI